MKEEILVSVMVFSYNAEKYIIELLESIREQTYQNIELIVSDDASTDRTATLAREWAKENEARFTRIFVQPNKCNQGVTKNANIGFQQCRGKYIKLIAGDDKLTPDCVEKMVAACEKNHYKALYGRMQSFYEGRELQEVPVNHEFYDMNAEEQYRHLLVVNEGMAPTTMYLTSFLKEMNYYDERYRQMEDYPFNLRMTKAGIKMNLLDEIVVYYRRNDNSVTSTTGETIVRKEYFRTYKKFFYREKFMEMLRYRKFRPICSELKEFLYKDLILLFGNKRGSRISEKLHRLFY